jgi:hypothetical protein
MNSTVSPYETAVEQEINRWSGFHRALRKEDREAFEELLQIFRNNAHASEAARNPFPFEPMVMSILTAQQKIIKQLEKDLQTLKQQKSTWSRAPK